MMQTASILQKLSFSPLLALLVLLSGHTSPHPAKTIIWKLRDTTMIGGHKPTVLGHPHVVHDKTGTALFFNGVDDGLILPVNPIQGLKSFTVELLFQPSADGPVEPRLLHGEDSEEARFTIELRITPKQQWYLDTFLKNTKAAKRLTLIDSTNLYPCDKWYWVALVYDGKAMTQYVNAVKVLHGPVDFESTATGQTAVGVRLNRVGWFRGAIREIRFHSSALKAKDLQQE